MYHPLCARFCTSIVAMDEEVDEDSNSDKSEQLQRSPRIREYPVGSQGPFVVYFRKISTPLKVLLISAELYSKFSSIKEVKKINEFKVRVILSKREEANAVVRMQRFDGVYRTYIPCADVEIDGVIYDEALTPNEVMSQGEGRFRNRAIPSVSILDCERLSMLGADKTSRIPSNALRITFAGTMIPDFACISKVLIPVRIYTPKVMLCARCNMFGHTEKFCTNKIKCIKCGDNHESSKCTINENTCILCKGVHDSVTTCKAYQDAKKQVRNKVMARSKATRVDLLKMTNDPIPTANPFALLDNELESVVVNDLEGVAHCSYNPPKKRKANSGTVSSTPISVKKSERSFPILASEQFPPLPHTKDVPGFKKVEHTETVDDYLVKTLKSLCNLFGINSSLCKVIESVAPILSKLWEMLKSLLPLLSPLVDLFRSVNGQE